MSYEQLANDTIKVLAFVEHEEVEDGEYIFCDFCEMSVEESKKQKKKLYWVYDFANKKEGHFGIVCVDCIKTAEAHQRRLRLRCKMLEVEK